MNSWCKNLELLIKSRNSLIWIKTKEEERLEKLVGFSCENLNSFGCLSYTFFTLIYLPLQKRCLENQEQLERQLTCGRELNNP